MIRKTSALPCRCPGQKDPDARVARQTPQLIEGVVVTHGASCAGIGGARQVEQSVTHRLRLPKH
jgi:hypothetical protein